MRERARERARRRRRCSRRRSACASTKASAARRPTSRCASSAPISTSWRSWRSRREQSMSGVDGLADLRAEQLTGLAAAADRRRPRRRRRASGSRRATSSAPSASAWSARRRREVWIGQRRFDLVVRLQDDRRERRQRASARCCIDGHDGTRIPLGQLADDRAGLRPGRDPAGGGQPAHRRRGERVAGATSAAPPREVRERLRARADSCRRATSSTSAGASRARRAPRVADRSRSPSRCSPSSCCCTSRSARSLRRRVILATLPDGVRRRHRGAADRRARPGTSRRWSA